MSTCQSTKINQFNKVKEPTQAPVPVLYVVVFLTRLVSAGILPAGRISAAGASDVVTAADQNPSLNYRVYVELIQRI